jgi:hypothetical protein
MTVRRLPPPDHPLTERTASLAILASVAVATLLVTGQVADVVVVLAALAAIRFDK